MNLVKYMKCDSKKEKKDNNKFNKTEINVLLEFFKTKSENTVKKVSFNEKNEIIINNA